MPWYIKLQDLRKQRTWEPKMWSFLSVRSLMQILLSRAKSNFPWLLNPLLVCSCISVDPSLFLPPSAGRLVLSHDWLTCYFGRSKNVFSMVSFHLELLLSVCVPCSILDGLWMSLTIGIPSGCPSCSDSWPQLHLGQGTGFSSRLKSPHLATITGLFSLCLPDILTTKLQKPYWLKWVKTREEKNEGHLK